MERSQLAVGDTVAVYPATPVPTDPYAHGYREHVRAMLVNDLDMDGQILVEQVPLDESTHRPFSIGNAEAVTPRQVVARWDDWERNLAERQARAYQQSNRAQRRVDEEARALAQAVATYPTARMEGHCIVIPVPDWLAVNDGRA